MQSRVEGQLLLDPTADEAYEEDGGLLLAYMPQASLVSLSHMLTGAALLYLPFTSNFTSDQVLAITLAHALKAVVCKRAAKEFRTIFI